MRFVPTKHLILGRFPLEIVKGNKVDFVWELTRRMAVGLPAREVLAEYHRGLISATDGRAEKQPRNTTVAVPFPR